LNGEKISLYALDVTWHILQQKDIFVFPNFQCGNQYESYSDIQKKKVKYNLNMIGNNKKKITSIRDLIKN
jgi:hypothetical protein